MEMTVLNPDLQAIAIVDTFESLIWTERYSAYGDFEFYAPVTLDALQILQADNYLTFPDSKQSMIVEFIEIESDVENGTHLTVVGRSLESILDRRIIWSQTIIKGNVQNGIKQLLTENVIDPSDGDRRIPNLEFEPSEDPAITSLELDSAQFTGDNLYDVIKALCDVFGIGFVIYIDGLKLKFKLYSGQDRSYNQSTNPWVVFSPKFDNLINSNYYKSTQNLKTIALVAGEGEGTARKTTTVQVSSETGLFRRELFVDARDISSETEGGSLNKTQYAELLSQRGKERLAENVAASSFEGQLDTSAVYIYGRDYANGDIVQIMNEYGIEARARVMEIVRSQSSSGFEIYPTLVMVE